MVMNEQANYRYAGRTERLKVVAFTGLAGFRCHSMNVVSSNILRELRARRIAVLDVPLRAPRWFQRIRPRLLAEFLLRYLAYPMLVYRCRQKFGDRALYFVTDHADSFLACFVGHAKVIILVQDLASMMPLAAIPFRKTWKTYLTHILGLVFKRRGVYRADHIVTGAETIRSDVVRWLRKQADGVTVIYDGFDEKTFTPGEKIQARGSLGLNRDDICILSVASSEPRKNISTLILALDKLRRRIANVKLLYVGNFDRTAQRAVNDTGLDDAVIRFRNISDVQLAELYRAADAYAFPSQYEGFGLPAVEAMACGCPVVTSTEPTLLEIVGGCGISATTNDAAALAEALERVLTNKSLAQQLVAAGLQRVKKFYWSNTAERLEKVFRAVGGFAVAPQEQDGGRHALTDRGFVAGPFDDLIAQDNLQATSNSLK